MSIYSGFATRQQQQLYNSYLMALLRNMHRRLLNFYKNQTSDESKFVINLKKLYANMTKMEKYKYLEPKFAPLFEQLLSFLQSDYPKPGLNIQQPKKSINPKQQTILSIHQSELQPLVATKLTSNKIIKQASINESQIKKTLEYETQQKILRESKNHSQQKKRQLSCNLSRKSQSRSQTTNKNYDKLNITAYQKYNTPQIDRDYNSSERNLNNFPNNHSNNALELVNTHHNQNPDESNESKRKNIKYYAKSNAIKLDDVGRKDQIIQKVMSNQKDPQKSSQLNKAQKYYLRAYHRHKKQMQSVFKQMSKDYIT